MLRTPHVGHHTPSPLGTFAFAPSTPSVSLSQHDLDDLDLQYEEEETHPNSNEVSDFHISHFASDISHDSEGQPFDVGVIDDLLREASLAGSEGDGLGRDEVDLSDEDGEEVEEQSMYDENIKAMLADAMHEVESLREEVREWRERCEDSESQLDELAETLSTNESNFTTRLAQIQHESESRVLSLESENESLTAELQRLRSTQQQVSTIRQSLQEEKDLEVLNLRVELMSEKERQLRVLREQMEVETGETFGRLEREMDDLKREFSIEKDSLVGEVHQLQALVDNLRSENAAMSARPETSSLGLQTDFENQLEPFKHIVDHLCTIFNLPALEPPTQLPDLILHHIHTLETTFESNATTHQSHLSHLESQLESQSIQLSTRESQLSDLESQTTRLDKQLRDTESAHAIALQSLHDAHESSLESLKQSYDHQISTLSEKVASLVDPNELETWRDVESRFPYLFSAFREEVRREVDLDSQRLVRQLRESMEKDKAEMTLFYERTLREERTNLRAEFDEDLARATEGMKEKCVSAYQAAVGKLKEEYVRLEGECRARFEVENGEGERLKGVVRNQEAYIANLEQQHATQLDQIKADFSALITRIKDEARIQYSNQLKLALQKMKDKYVETLRTQQQRRVK
ncbi:hypothetical protein HDU98_009805 [Podochytrium sp. JEL0797]|nr:hypothetical protein HDU98_009805 [Podochytrium sp. JEL0797]